MVFELLVIALGQDNSRKWKLVFRNFYSNLTLLGHYVVFIQCMYLTDYKELGSNNKKNREST